MSATPSNNDNNSKDSPEVAAGLSNTPDIAKEAVMVKSGEVPEGTPIVRGYDFNNGVNYEEMFKTYVHCGFQATNVGRGIEEINRMINWRMSDDPVKPEDGEDLQDPEARKKFRCKIFLGYTSNLISSGLREVLRYLAQHKMVDVIVSSAGGVEEDFIKCLAPTYMGDFHLRGAALRKEGLNRIGNLIVPNDNYCKFQDWMFPILDKMLEEQKNDGVVWTPSKMIHRLGKEINHEDSVYYWAYKNNIPVYCPSITDGSIGDMVFFHSFENPGLVIDIAGDIRAMNLEAMFAKKTGMIILGGGLVKHHICNANLMRNGADFACFVNTAQEFDGSDAGARPDEAVSWGKIRLDAQPVKIYAEATVVFPILVAETFAKNFEKRTDIPVNE